MALLRLREKLHNCRSSSFLRYYSGINPLLFRNNEEFGAKKYFTNLWTSNTNELSSYLSYSVKRYPDDFKTAT